MTEREIAFEQRCKEASIPALEYLTELVEDPAAPTRERREAALAVINHGHGMPVARNLIAQIGATGSPQELTRQELSARLERLFDGDITDVRNAE